jgi:hypothetical protein
MKVYPVAITIAWQLWEKDVDAEAPLPKISAKAHRMMKKTQKLIQKCKIKFISQDPMQMLMIISLQRTEKPVAIILTITNTFFSIVLLFGSLFPVPSHLLKPNMHIPSSPMPSNLG